MSSDKDKSIKEPLIDSTDSNKDSNKEPHKNDAKTAQQIRQEEKKKILDQQYIKDYGYTKDAYDNAWFINKLFFYWAYKIIKLSNNVKLEAKHLGLPKNQHKSEEYLRSLNNIWENKGYKKRKTNALFCTVLRNNLCNLFLMVVFSLIVTGLEVFSIAAFRWYILAFSDDEKKKTEGIPFGLVTYQIALIFGGTKLIIEFLKRQLAQFQMIVGFQSGFELNCFIYAKVLKASPSSMTKKSSEGEIVNYIQVDSNRFGFTMQLSPALLTVPTMLVAYSYMLFAYFGLSFLFGLAVLILSLITNYCIYGKYRVYMKENLRLKDNRMSISTETISCLKILKLYAWENEFTKRITESRNEELALLRKIFNLTIFNIGLSHLAPALMAFASIAAYQGLNDVMKIEDILICLNIFNIISGPIRQLPFVFNSFLETMISMNRIEVYIKQADIQAKNISNDFNELDKDLSIRIPGMDFSWGKDENEEKKNKEVESKKKKEAEVKEKEKEKNKKINDTENENSSTNKSQIQDSNNTTILDNDAINKDDTIIEGTENQTLKSENKKISKEGEIRTVLKDINIEVMQGELVAIIGEVGSDKSSLLQAILNNMIILNNEKEKKQMQIKGSVSYVPQISWIENATLRSNIIFNGEFNEEKYQQTLDLCELRDDIKGLIGGDMTEIGEKGINLSGGQKARVSLARAAYFDADIILLDDPISALDAHVGQNVMTNLITGQMKNKTRLLVTHAIQYLNLVDKIIYVSNGKILFQGGYADLIDQAFYKDFTVKLKKTLSKKASEEEEKAKKEDLNKEKKDEEKNAEVKRITVEEEREEGQVDKSIYHKYIVYSGGYCLFLTIILIMVIWQGMKLGSDIWLVHWQSIQDKASNWFNLGIYGALGVGSSIFVFFRVWLLTIGSIKNGKKIHEEMIDNLVGAPINLFHDTVPKGRILNRLSKDLINIDMYTMFQVGGLLDSFMGFAGSIIICSIYSIYSLAFLPVLLIAGYFVTRFYIVCSRDITRIEGVVRSPMINLLAETVPGSITIRAFKQETVYMNKFHERTDINFSTKMFLSGISNWFGLILGLFSLALLVFLLIFSTLVKESFTQGEIGMMLTYAVKLQTSLFELLTNLTTFENSMVAMERCLKFTTLPKEKPQILESDKELSSEIWPTEGKVSFKNYSVKYRPNTEVVLKDLSFDIQGGHKVGVVGRTGSGKSTLCLCLFRLLEPLTGTIFIDGIDICNVGLHKLRSNLTIIPQDPSLMQGSLKYNIDPIGQYSNEQIEEIMKNIGFYYVVENHYQGIEQPVTESGTNLSVGEKQLICICRALLRVSNIFCLF